MEPLNEFFLAADDDEARRAARDGAVAAGWEDVVHASGLTNLDIELLEEAVTGRPSTTAPRALITGDGGDPEASFVVPFPDGLTDALLELRTAEVRPAAERWARANIEPAALASLLEDLVGLVSIGVTTGRGPYLWVCL